MKFIVLIDTRKKVERVHFYCWNYGREKKNTHSFTHSFMRFTPNIFRIERPRWKKNDCCWKIIQHTFKHTCNTMVNSKLVMCGWISVDCRCGIFIRLLPLVLVDGLRDFDIDQLYGLTDWVVLIDAVKYIYRIQMNRNDLIRFNSIRFCLAWIWAYSLEDSCVCVNEPLHELNVHHLWFNAVHVTNATN